MQQITQVHELYYKKKTLVVNLIHTLRDMDVDEIAVTK